MLGLILLLSALIPASSRAFETFLTMDEALALAYPKCEFERTAVYLTEADVKAIAKSAGVPFKGRVFYAYRATQKGKHLGTAYFDTHPVRSLRETLMVAIAPDQSIQRIEVLAFAEPKEYIPRSAFYDQFKKRKLDSELRLNRKIRNVTGATLTSRATTECARRLLALHKFLEKRKAEKEGDKPKAEEAKRSSRADRLPKR